MSTTIGPLAIDEEIMKKIQKVFPPSKFRIKKSGARNNQVEIFLTDGENDELCVEFYFLKTYIRIIFLEKRKMLNIEVTGNEILYNVYYIAKSIPNIKYILLDDESIIKLCDYNIYFSVLKILTTGISWYNDNQYFSEDYINEKKHNEEIINMKYSVFLNIVNRIDIEEFKKRKSITYSLEDLEKYISNQTENWDSDYIAELEELNLYISNQKEETYIGNHLYPPGDLTVQDYFKNIYSDIKKDIGRTSCGVLTTQKCEWLESVISKISKVKILKYNPELKREVIRRTFGGGKTKKRKYNQLKKRKYNRSKNRK